MEPTMAPDAAKICVHDRPLSASARTVSEARARPRRSASASINLAVQLGASATEA